MADAGPAPSSCLWCKPASGGGASHCQHTAGWDRSDTHTYTNTHTRVQVVLPEDSGCEEDQADVVQFEGEGEEDHPEEGENVDQQGGHPAPQQHNNISTTTQQHNCISLSAPPHPAEQQHNQILQHNTTNASQKTNNFTILSQ